MKALDFSFDAANITPAWCVNRLLEGYELAVCDLWTGRQPIQGAEQALRCWREAGGRTGGYFCVHDSRPVAEHFNNARACAGAEWARLSVVAVDVEIDPVTTVTVRAAADAVTADGLRVAVYTGEGAWSHLTGNSTDCADLPLWDAAQGMAPSLELAPPYGGWRRRAGHQYQGTTAVDGIAVDVSLFDDMFIAPGPTPGPTPDAEWANVEAVLTGWGHELPQLAGQVGASAPDASTANRLREAGHEIGDVAGIIARLRGEGVR